MNYNLFVFKLSPFNNHNYSQMFVACKYLFLNSNSLFKTAKGNFLSENAIGKQSSVVKCKLGKTCVKRRKKCVI